MSIKQGLTGAQLFRNDELIGYKAGSLEITPGNPEITYTNEVLGNGKTRPVATRDYETAIGELKFNLITTVENLALADTWANASPENVFKVLTITGVSYIFEGASITNKFSAAASNDGEIPIEISSEQMRFA